MAYQVQNITHLLNSKSKLYTTDLTFEIDGKNYTIKPSDYLVVFKNALPKSVLEKQMKGLVLVSKYSGGDNMKVIEKREEPKSETINTVNKNNFIKDELFEENIDTELEDLDDTPRENKRKKK